MTTGLSISNPKPRKLPGPQLLHDLVPRELSTGISAIEHAADDGSITSLGYGELHKQAEAVAQRIIEATKQRQDDRFIVPISIPQSLDLYISQLAVLKAGGAFCPIVLDAPEERLRFILQDTGAKVLLTTTTILRQLATLDGIEVITVDEGQNTTDTSPLDPQITPQDAAYVMYTSGSTGQPKGVIISHSAATQALLAHDEHIPKFSRFLQFASPTFDVSVFEIFFPWYRRSTLVSCDRKRLLNDLPAAINDLRIDACELTPSVASSLLRGRASVPSLRVLLTIGEMLKPSVVEDFGGSPSECALLQGMYGPTEATIHCTLQKNFPKDMACGMIGFPLQTVSAFVVKAQDEDSGQDYSLEILKLGEEGELAVGGHQLANGYLNREEQTKAAFVEHPEYGLLYRTGDRARMLPNGSLECLGRISSGQVKLRGQRIELGEVEHVASRTSGCRDVVAEVVQGILVIFCVAESASVTKPSILTTCRKWLPSFMVPGDVILLDALPYLASGKADRKTLRQQYIEAQTQPSDKPTQHGEEAERVLDVLGDVLGTAVTATSSLAGLGVDSLLSIRITAALRKAGFRQVDATEVLAAHTPLDIVQMFDSDQQDMRKDRVDLNHRNAVHDALLQAMDPVLFSELEDYFPCTPVQIAMLTETHKQADAYCNWAELSVTGSSSCSDVITALHELIRVHPMLRSGFVPISNTQWSFATVIWTHGGLHQVLETSNFNYDFSLQSEGDFLRPSNFQVVQAQEQEVVRVIFQTHHAVFDQWSLDLLRVHLEAILEGQQLPHPKSFRLVADYHAEMLRNGVPPSTIDFWQQNLREANPTTLPLLQAQQVSPSLARTGWRELNQDLSSFRSLSQQLNCSPPAVLQAAWVILLGSYTGSSDVTTGCVFSGRNIPVDGVDEIFGPCLATLPLRIDTNTASTCADLVVALTERTRAMQKHAWTPPTSIRQAAGIMPGVTLFDSLFIWQESLFSGALHDCRVDMLDSKDQLEFSMVLEFEPTPTKIKMRATYQQSLISSEQVDLFLRQLDELASIIVTSPHSTIEGIWAGISSDVLSIANLNYRRYSDKFDLISVIQQHAADDPSATAILFAESISEEGSAATSISYSKLDARASRMAHLFIAAGLKPEGLVCICMEKCIDLYVAMLASFKAGAGYLPLVPETPAARVKAVLAQTTINLCVCDRDSKQLFERLTTAPVLDISITTLSAYPSTPPAVDQIGSRVSYAVFTSGSTGEPKGVAVTMDNLKGNLGVLGELYQVQPGDRLLQACSQAFDVSVFEIFFAFYSGMCLCTATKEVMFSDFERSIRSFQATHLSLTPTVAALVQPENVPSVKFLVTAGEGITEKVHRLWSGKGLHQGYGPSETTNICTVKMHHSPQDVLGNIGPPFRNTSAFVLSPSGEFNILPAGAYGEFAFGGEQVFQGYINREDLNNTKVIDHQRYGRVYKSGDMGRILPDGTLLISGRLDDQVKIRGNRVELGEINAIVSNHQDTLDCTTIVLGEGSSKQALVTFFVPRSRRRDSASNLSIVETSPNLIAEIFGRLEDALPAYMIPSTLLPVNYLPITPQGKLDKRLLQQTLNGLDSSDRDRFSRSHESSSGDRPTSPMEVTMAETLVRVLDVPLADISRDTSFFALGLNSLNAMQFARSLQKALNTAVGVTAVMKHSSLARLAQALSTSAAETGQAASSELQVFPEDALQAIKSTCAGRELQINAILPCTPLQQAMLSASVSRRGEAYCNTTKLNVSGDVDKLRNVWDKMMERHTILRTTFVETTSAAHPYAQVILKTPPHVWYIIRKDSTQANGNMNGTTNGHTNGLVTHMPKLPPATAEMPLAVYQDGHHLYLQMHHAIYDGISVANLFDEMEKLYRGQSLPAPVSFEPFLAEVLRHNGDEARKFWSQRFRGFELVSFPPQEDPDDEYEAGVGGTIPIEAQHLQAFCTRHSCTPLSIFQAAWAKTLACAQHVSDLCFGNVVTGRSVPVSDIDRLVAPCFNTVPLRSQIEQVRTNLGLVQDMHQANIDTMPFQLTSPRLIQALSGKPSQHLFDSLLLLQPQQDESELWTVEEDSMVMSVPLALEIIPYNETYELELQYMPEVISHSSASALVDGFMAALMSCVRYPSSAPDHFLDFDKGLIAGRLNSKNKLSSTNGQLNGIVADDQDWSETEETIRTIFSKLAGVESQRISKQTSLYQIGLDSLNAVQVASGLRKSGFKLDAADVMQYQTPAALASYLDSGRTDVAPQQADIDLSAFDDVYRKPSLRDLELHEHAVEAVWPCTPTQSGMLAQFIQTQGTLYMSHSVYGVPESVSFDAVKAAWAAVERKHQVLRMGFHRLDNANTPFAMIVYKPGKLVNEIDVSARLPEQASFEQFARDDVLDALHLPAWRLHLNTLHGNRKMSLALHHALYDADSLQILLTDFGRAIQGGNLGPAVGIDQVIIKQISGTIDNKSAAADFWKKTLDHAAVVKFPNLTPTIVAESRAKTTHLSSTITMAAMESFCRDRGVTIQALGQGVWAMLLAQYQGEPNVTFGTVFSGFSDTSQPVAFPTISTLPVHCDASKDDIDLLHDMVTYNASIQRHRFTPLADVQRYAGSPGQALFDTIFVYQKSPEATQDGFGWQTIVDDLGIDFVASMEMETPASGTVQLRLTHDAQTIPADHASLMIRQFDTLLQDILNGEQHRRPHDMPLMSYVPAKESTIPCSVSLLHEFVERGAKTHPDRPALEFIHALEGGEKSRRTWTYKQLDERSNQVAQLIQQRGVQPGGIVAVCMTKSAEASFAFVGILKAGCAFLAMDPDLPPARRTFITEDSKSQLLFVDAGKADEELHAVVSTVELTEDLLTKWPSSPVTVPDIQPDATSYCLYTSGTTGTPKGCELTHENAVQAMMSFQRLFAGHWDLNSRWLQFASYWFDVSVLEHFWSWSVGITVVGAPRDLVLEDLAGFIQRANITHIDLTPSLARLLTPDQVPSLWNHVFITGGEALKQEIIDRWGPYKTICNGYGPTEATIGVTMNPYLGHDAKPSNIGPPFDNVGAYVFAPGTDEIVLRGAVGELCVSGKLVGKGYLNRPDLTTKAFPFLERHGERVYRTGDLVRLLADGSVSFIGRADTQAKLRGQRLEIDEIDAVIKSSTSNVSDVASLVVKSKEGSREMLVSFVVNDAARTKELQVSTSENSLELVQMADQACRDRLPGYMVPTHILPLTRLPLTVNNKVDTKWLAALFTSMTTRDLQQIKGSNGARRELQPVEKKIADALARLLSTEVSDMIPDSNFFSLGLSSVSAISFATALKRNGLQEVSVAMIMKHPTIQGLYRALSKGSDDNQAEQNVIKQAQLTISAFARRHRGAAAKALSIETSLIESLALCTPLQEGLLVESIKSERRPYFNQFLYDVSTRDVDRLVAALDKLQALVPMLRTFFLNTDEGFAQVVLRERHSKVDVVPLKEGSAEGFLYQRKRDWVQIVTHDLLRPFEVFVVTTADKVTLVFHAHHALYDGISWDLMMDRLVQLYQSPTSPIDIGPGFIDVLPYGPLCHQPHARHFWQHRLENKHFIGLAQTKDDKAADLFTTKTFSFDSKLEAVRRQLAVSHQAVVQVAFAIALHQFSSQTQCYGVVLSGRSISYDRADEVIGPMFNTVPYAVDLQATDKWKDILLRSHQSNSAAVPYQHTPLRDIRKACGRHPSDPMFDVLFVFQRPTSTDGSSHEEALFKPTETQATAEYPLAVEIELDVPDNIAITIAAQGQYASADSLDKLMQDIETALGCISHNVDQKISSTFNVQVRSDQGVDINGQADIPRVDGSDGFDWTPDAVYIKESIAQLAGCETSDVTEHTGIFTLGLDSIDAVKLGSRLKKAGLLIPVSQILKAQTIPKMLEALHGEPKASPATSEESKLSTLERQLEAIRDSFDEDLRDRIERILPATPGQEALVADMVRSEFRQYYNSDVLRINDDVDNERLKMAWQIVVDASPILRTSFVEADNPDIEAVFAQVVHRPSTISFQELSASTTQALDDYIAQARIDAMATLATTPPLRLALAGTGNQRFLILSMAHAQYDGHSLALLHEDVAKAYSGDLEPRPIYDGVIDLALDATTDKALQFWRDTLNGAQVNRISNIEESVTTRTIRAERVVSTTVAEARRFCKTHGVSLQALTQAAWALLLSTYTKHLEVMFGIVLACRDSEAAEAVMFPTMNTIPMRASIHGTGSDIVRYIQGINNDARPYQQTPLRAIQSACSGVVQSHSGLFDTLFIYQQRPEDVDRDHLALYESVDADSNVEYPVAIEAETVRDGILVRAACKSNVLDERGTRSLLQKFDHVLQYLVESPEKSTVSFSDESVSICGLPNFQLNDNTMGEQTNTNTSFEENRYVETELPDEHAIRAALAQVAKVPEDEVSSYTKMEAIGIDSISAIKVTALLRKQSIRLPVSSILKAQTPRRMAELVESNTATPAAATSSADTIATHLEGIDSARIAKAIGIKIDDIECIMPATAGQQYMLSMWHKTDGELFYPTFSYHVKTERDAHEIHAAWDQVVSRNPILRMVLLLPVDSKTPLLQIVLKQHSQVSSPRPLQPMVGLQLDKAQTGYVASLRIHHALYDAVSLPLLMQELESGMGGTLPPVSRVQLHDYVATTLRPEAHTAKKDFWTKYLRAIDPAALDQPNSTATRKVQIFKPDAFTLCSDLERYCRSSRISVQALLFAIYAKVYVDHAKQARDAVFGIYLANRSHLPDLERLAAPTLNLLPLLVCSPQTTDLLTLAKHIDADLRDIGSADVSSASLKEIADWTGVKVDSFVNFLKLPEQSEKEIPREGDTVIDAVEEWTEDTTRVIEPGKSGKSSMPAELRDFKPADVYQHAVDVEISMASGRLSIGLFCLEEMLSLEEAESFVVEMANELEGSVSSGD